MIYGTPTHEFGRPDPKVDLHKLEAPDIIALLRTNSRVDPYYAIDIANYVFKAAYASPTESLARPETQLVITKDHLRKTGNLALTAISNTDWTEELQQDVRQIWEERLTSIPHLERDDPAA